MKVAPQTTRRIPEDLPLITFKSANDENRITSEKRWEPSNTEDLDGIIYTLVQQFIAWRKESHDIDIRLDAILRSR